MPHSAAYLGMSRQWCYQRLKTICPPVTIGGRIRWLKEDLDGWKRRRIAGMSDAISSRITSNKALYGNGRACFIFPC